MKKGLLLLLLIAIIALVSCSKKKTTEPPDPNANIVSSAVVILTQQEANSISAVTAEQVIFTGDLVTAAKFPAGKIIVSRPGTVIPNGLLRKVLSASAVGNVVTVETTSATLEDVFTQADFETEQPLRVSGVRSTKTLMEGVSFISDDRDPEKFTYPINVDVVLGNGINLLAYGSLSIDHSFILSLHKHKLDGITDVNFKYNSHQTNTMSFSVNGASPSNPFDYSLERDLIEQTFAPVVLTVGTAPVVVTPKMLVKLLIDTDGEGNVICNLTSNVTYSTELDYAKPTWTSTHTKSISYTHNANNTNVFNITQPENLVIGSGARMSLMFYGVASPYTETMSYLNLNASNIDVPWWTLNGRFKAATGFDMTPVGTGNSYAVLNLIDETEMEAQATAVTCADPEFTPAAGTYDGDQHITITTSTTGAQIRYTLDGSQPLQSSALYTAPILLNADTTIKARVFKLHANPSQIVESAYVVHALPTVATPVFDPLPGTYPVPQSVTITCATPGADIRYTTNGAEPNIGSALYTNPISVTSQMTLKARGFKTGYNISPLAAGYYLISTIQTVSDPVITPEGGTYNSAQNVAIYCSTSGAQIKYTLDGSDPTESSNSYTSPLVISKPTTLKAKCFKTGWNPSQIASEVYNYSIYEVGYLDTPGTAKALAMAGNLVLVADFDNGIRLIDVTDPANPTETGVYNLTGHSTYDVVINGSNAYIAYGIHGFTVLDVSNPAAPTVAGSYTPPGEVQGVAMNANMAYLANLNHGVRFVSIADLANITSQGVFNPNGTEVKVAVVGTTVYTANSNDGLYIVDASVPAVPVQLGHYGAPGTTYDLSIVGNYAYLGTSQGLRIVNISVPNQLVLTGSLTLPDEVNGVRIRGGYAYLANGNGGLKVVDISNPASPVLVNTFNTPGYATDVTVNGDYAYVTDGTSGLRVIYVGNRTPRRK